MNKILVVDDDLRLRRLVSVILRSNGYDVLEAEDGFSALDELPRQPDLVILDLSMPVMDGESFYHEAQRRGYRGQTLVLSAQLYGSQIAGRMDCHYLPKPFDPDELGEEVESLLQAPSSSALSRPPDHLRPRWQ